MIIVISVAVVVCIAIVVAVVLCRRRGEKGEEVKKVAIVPSSPKVVANVGTSGIKFCTACGSQMPIDSQFCAKCGQKA